MGESFGFDVLVAWVRGAHPLNRSLPLDAQIFVEEIILPHISWIPLRMRAITLCVLAGLLCLAAAAPAKHLKVKLSGNDQLPEV